MPNTKISLSEFANVVIVRCRITGIPGITKQDKARTAKLATTEGTNKRHGRVTKTLFAESARAKALKTIGASVRNWIRVASLPGEADGKYMIPAHLFETFADKLNKWQEEYRKILADFVANIDEEVSNDMKRKRGLSDAADYPTSWDVQAAATFDWGFEPLPSSSQFSEIFDGDALVRQMEEQHEKHVVELFSNATDVNLERMHGRISASMGQLKRYTGASGQRLHCEGLVLGMKETAKTAGALNVANSEEVRDLANAMIQWCDEYKACDTLKAVRTRQTAIKELGNMLGDDTSVPAGWEVAETSLPETEQQAAPEPETAEITNTTEVANGVVPEVTATVEEIPVDSLRF